MWHRLLGATQILTKQFLSRQCSSQVVESITRHDLHRLCLKRQFSHLSFGSRDNQVQQRRTCIETGWCKGSLSQATTTLQWLVRNTQQPLFIFKTQFPKETIPNAKSYFRRYSTVPAAEQPKQDGDQQKTKEPQFLIYDSKKGWHFFFLTFLSSSQLGIWLAEKLEGTRNKDENPSLLARNISGIASVVGLICLFMVFWYSRNFISEMWIVGHSAQKLIIRTYTIIGTKTAPKHLLTKTIMKGRVKQNSNYVGIKVKGAKFSYILDKGGRFVANEELINSFENGASAIFVTWSRVYPTLKHTAT